MHGGQPTYYTVESACELADVEATGKGYHLLYLRAQRFHLQIARHRQSSRSNPELCTNGSIAHKLDIVVQLKTSLRITRAGHKIHNERILDREGAVALHVLVLTVEDLRSERTVAIVRGLHT